MQRLSARPHHVGSPYDKDNAEWLLAQLKSQITRTAAAIEREAGLLKSATQTLTAK
jgi:hypothetical protein